MCLTCKSRDKNSSFKGFRAICSKCEKEVAVGEKLCRTCRQPNRSRSLSTDRCSSCRAPLNPRAPKACSQCKELTVDWYCTKCNWMVPANRRVCETCLARLVQCRICRTYNLPEERVCVSCAAGLMRVESFLSNRQALSRKATCKCCNRVVSESEKRNCRLCCRRCPTQNCPSCGIYFSVNICDLCKHSRWICNCLSIYSKHIVHCNCGLINNELYYAQSRSSTITR